MKDHAPLHPTDGIDNLGKYLANKHGIIFNGTWDVGNKIYLTFTGIDRNNAGPTWLSEPTIIQFNKKLKEMKDKWGNNEEQ